MCRSLLTALSQYQLIPPLWHSAPLTWQELSCTVTDLWLTDWDLDSLHAGGPLRGGREIDRDTDGGNDFQKLGPHAKLVFDSAWPTDKIMFCMVTTRTLYVHHRVLVKASFIYIAAPITSGLAPLHDHGHSHTLYTYI